MEKTKANNTYCSRPSPWHDIAYWVVLLAACGVFLVMNVLTPYKEDDMGFTLIDGVWAPVRSLADAARSYCNHFANTNGRLADLVPTLFAGVLGKGAFNVCNTLVFGLFAHLMSLLVTRRRSITVVALLLAVVGTCFPVPGETMLWMAGSANYMWAITLSLLLVYCLQRRQGQPLGWGEGVLFAVGALVAGGFNEATSFGFFDGLCLYYVFNRRLFDRRAAVALLGYLVGLLMIMASPAAWDRAAGGDIALNLTFGELLHSRGYILLEKAWRFYLPVAALAVGVIALILRRGGEVRRCVWTYVFLCLSLVLFALGILYERVYAPWVAVSFLIVALGLELPMSRWPWLRSALAVVALGLAVFTFARGVKVLKEYKAFDDQAVAEVVAAPDQAVLQQRQFPGYSRFIKPVNYMSSNFFAHEIIYRNYYGKTNVQFVDDSVFTRFHEGRLLDGAMRLNAVPDRPDILGDAYVFPDQDYMAVELRTDTLPATFQTARYQAASDSVPASFEEKQRRQRYGINLDYVPQGFYPLEYQGRRYLISRCPDSTIRRMIFPLDITSAPVEATLTLVP